MDLYRTCAKYVVQAANSHTGPYTKQKIERPCCINIDSVSPSRQHWVTSIKDFISDPKNMILSSDHCCDSKILVEP